MGRPKKELTSLKIIQVNIRMTVDDYIKVSLSAETIGLSITEYIRRKITKRSLPKKRISPYDRKLFVELSRVGNNLNQITKVVNSGIWDPFSIHRQLEEVKVLLQYLKSNIAHNDW
ncbi:MULTISPECIES: plasmid mobilization protein [Flavobacteriaceae]|nr:MULTISPECIES: plasmid mobilization relaxosome protein MobC [Flavobacteriaceae]